jgi:hypothetical protein
MGRRSHIELKTLSRDAGEGVLRYFPRNNPPLTWIVWPVT